ncbi:MAG TPA: hypothetical protein VIA18_05015 [Polyangia bacterium]|jgi:hypothetical protein|nr:hypothetical protein [Polyangia bacterium]
MTVLLLLATLVGAIYVLRLLVTTRAAQRATPALRLAGGPPDDARHGPSAGDDDDDARAGRPLLDAIALVLRAHGAEVAAVQADDWGFAAAAVVEGQPLTLKLGAHGANGVGPEWLLVLDGAQDSAALRRAIETAAAGVAGVKLLGWDD